MSAQRIDSGKRVVDGNLEPLGYQQITSLSASTTLTVPDGARMAVLVAETQDVRWRDDGTAPTTTVGMLLSKNVPFVYTGLLDRLRFIETTASAKLNVSYYL